MHELFWTTPFQGTNRLFLLQISYFTLVISTFQGSRHYMFLGRMVSTWKHFRVCHNSRIERERFPIIFVVWEWNVPTRDGIGNDRTLVYEIYALRLLP